MKVKFAKDYGEKDPHRVNFFISLLKSIDKIRTLSLWPIEFKEDIWKWTSVEKKLKEKIEEACMGIDYALSSEM